MKKEIDCQCLIEKISYLAFMDPFHLGPFKSKVQQGENNAIISKIIPSHSPSKQPPSLASPEPRHTLHLLLPQAQDQ